MEMRKKFFFVRYHLYAYFLKIVTEDLNWWLAVTLLENKYRRERNDFRHFTLKKSRKRFITKYIPNVRFVIS